MTTENLLPMDIADHTEVANGLETQPMTSATTKGHPTGTPILRVFGVGGAGCNAISRMAQDNMGVVEYYGVNTDAQHLSRTSIDRRLPIGQSLTRGLGAGGDPSVGSQAAEESREELTRALTGADMVFIAAGMGGGTGTGAAPVVAQIAKEAGALTVAVVGRPFYFENTVRRQNAELGIAGLKDHVDTLIVIPNDRLLQLSGADSEPLSWDGALNLADSVLQQGIQAIAEVVTIPGEINVDFADIKTIMSNAGPAWLAIGHGQGEHRAIEAAQMAVQSPLLDILLEGAKRILFVITGGASLTLKEVQEAARVIEDVADPEANIIFGTSKDTKMEDQVKVTLVASAFPVNRDNGQERLVDLEELLRPASNGHNQEHEVPDFLRKEAAQARGLRRIFR